MHGLLFLHIYPLAVAQGPNPHHLVLYILSLLIGADCVKVQVPLVNLVTIKRKKKKEWKKGRAGTNNSLGVGSKGAIFVVRVYFLMRALP